MSSPSTSKNNYEQLKQASSKETMNNNENDNKNNNDDNNINENEASTSTAIPEDPKLKQELDEYIEKQRELLSSPMEELSKEEYSKVLNEYRTLLDLYRKKQITPEQKKTLNERHQTLVKYQYQHLNPEQQENYLIKQREQAKIKKIKEQQQRKKDMYDNLRYYAKEISSIIRPVILCICLSILWVKLTRTVDTSLITSTDINIIGNGSSSGESEAPPDGFDYKGLLNSFLNAGLIIGNIVIATFVILLLFKFNCSKVLYGLFMFTVFMLIGIFGYNLLSTLIYIYNIPMDWITLIIFMFNLSIVGVIVIFWKGPARIQQGYLILMSSLMAFSLTGLADWTTWILLALLACWDLIAVLCPFGPLKMLVEHSDSNKQMIPQALIYSTMIWMMAQDVRINIDGDGKNNDDMYELNEVKQFSSNQLDECEASSQGSTQELIGYKQRHLSNSNNNEDYKVDIKDDAASDISNNQNEKSNKKQKNKEPEADNDDDDNIEENDNVDEDSDKQNLTNSNSRRSTRHNSEQQGDNREGRENNGNEDGEDEGLKLGLGDFVFYSVLIARAGKYSNNN